jgi:two-component system, NtrC family, nitrogen regulation sensor histidine kinase NtrY
MAMQKGKIYLILLALGIFLMLASSLFNKIYTYSLGDLAIKSGGNFLKKSLACKQALKQLSAINLVEKNLELNKLFDTEKIGVYLFNRDSLIYWNNAQFPITQNLNFFADSFGVVKLRQGYYLYVKSTDKSFTGIAICFVKPLYELQNNYLKNNFLEWTDLPKEVEMDFSPTAKYSVVLNGKKLFAIKGDEQNYLPNWVANSGILFFIIGFLITLVAILVNIKNSISHLYFLITIAGVVGLRYLMIYFKWPAFFYKSILYDVQLFGNANSQVNFYLGDILLNAFTLLFISVAFHVYIKNAKKIAVKRFGSILLFAFIFLIVNQFNHALISLVTNSTLSFDFLNIFNIKLPAFIGVLALAIYSLALYVALNKAISFFEHNGWLGFFQFLLLSSAVCVLQWLTVPTLHAFENYWFLFFAVTLFALVKLSYSKMSLGLGLQILIMSFITALLLTHYIEKNQQQNLKILSNELSERRDDILESEFAGIPNKIKSDESLSNLIGILPNTKNEIEQLLKQKYFGEYFNRYHVDFSLFNIHCEPLLSPKQAVLLNEGFFEDQIKYNSDSTVVSELFFVKNYKNNSQYIGKIKLREMNLYVFLEPKQFEEQGSFPDLLLDQSQQKQEEFRNFSYAIYRLGQNTSKYGDFNYPFFILDSLALSKSNPNYSHYYFRNDESVEIISQKTKTWTDRFTYNSYLFLFFSIISYCCFFIYMAVFNAQFIVKPSLTRRVQTIIVILLLLLMMAVGVTSGNLVSRQFKADNTKQLQEKTRIIINELTSEYKTQELFDKSQKELLSLKLNEYAHLFNTVISLFDEHGQLFNTSQPRLYDLGLAASLANPSAFWDLKQNKSSAASVNEMAGSLNYTSLYTPLYDSKKEIIGFLNLPHFARQRDLVNELSGIISALINVYVILFVISILAGLILSGYITQPLRLIKQQIANITLGKQNEKITWESNDEIGQLVSEYNQMLIKLETSANMLAKSERESAWREMAKQVAHEIKNPLTPMKLNLQYLQHLMKNNPADFHKKFEKTSIGIIEQIDSLANIATEFSNFAKLPSTQLETINLVEIINSSVLIFENHKTVFIKNHLADSDLKVMGDKDQCLRVFNNILKNAYQALEETINPHIEIASKQDETSITISICDNGCGIAEALKDKIFSPNFTTKTNGSGLGLAMVKNIMLGFGGNIWFESNSETTFYLSFLKPT